jgi:hypothetical protein
VASLETFATINTKILFELFVALKVVNRLSADKTISKSLRGKERGLDLLRPTLNQILSIT